MSPWIQESDHVHYFHSPPVLPHSHYILWVFLLLEVPKFVISCYRSARKLPHGRYCLSLSHWPSTDPTETWVLHTFLTVMSTKNRILSFPEKSVTQSEWNKEPLYRFWRAEKSFSQAALWQHLYSVDHSDRKTSGPMVVGLFVILNAPASPGFQLEAAATWVSCLHHMEQICLVVQSIYRIWEIDICLFKNFMQCILIMSSLLLTPQRCSSPPYPPNFMPFLYFSFRNKNKQNPTKMKIKLNKQKTKKNGICLVLANYS